MGLATSPDGIAWAVANGGLPILEPSGEAWEGTRVGSPRIVEMGDGTVRLYYTGTRFRTTKRIRARARAKERERSREAADRCI